MKKINILLISIFITIGFISCEDDKNPYDLSDKNYIKIHQTSISIGIGEEFKITPSFNNEETAAQKLTWSVMDPSVATAISNEDNSGIITGVSVGSSIIKVESGDKKISHFIALNVLKDNPLKILVIGDSFSEDAVEYYLHDLIKSSGKNTVIGNLYLENASLKNHWYNVDENSETPTNIYELRKIGVDGKSVKSTELKILDAIVNDNWDYICFQELSSTSGIIDNYKEYLPLLLEYVKTYATNPKVKYLLHQPWAYAKDSKDEGFANYENDQTKMFESIVNSVWEAKNLAGIDQVVPLGTAIQNGRTTYISEKYTRDGQHLNTGIGRFTAACTWFETLFGDVKDNTFVPEGFSSYDADLAKEAAFSALSNPKEVTELVDYKYPESNSFVLEHAIYIDFGPKLSGDPFNNFAKPADGRLSNLKDEKGNNSGFVIEVAKEFSGTIDRNNIENSLGLPNTVSNDMFFTDAIRIPMSSLYISKLNRDLKYTFVFYNHINENSVTETIYHVAGANEGEASLFTSKNMDKVAIVKDISVDDNNGIMIELTAGPNNVQFAKFIGISALLIVPEGYPLPFP